MWRELFREDNLCTGQEVGQVVKENTGSGAESSVSKSPATFRNTV